MLDAFGIVDLCGDEARHAFRDHLANQLARFLLAKRCRPLHAFGLACATPSTAVAVASFHDFNVLASVHNECPWGYGLDGSYLTFQVLQGSFPKVYYLIGAPRNGGLKPVIMGF